ncbi:MAG: glycosyltransferase family 2 protein [Planctomycetes bacterium]|nr:glycosyltransferase family 2 protein [Planctomycetota bacterium]
MAIAFWAIIFLLIYPYLVYPVLLVILAAICGKKHAVDDNYTPAVTLIIPAHNEEDCIADKIKNALALDYPREKLQILIGSDGSKDRTNEIVSSFKEPNILFMPFETQSGKMSVINKCVPRATGEIIVLTDANAMFEPGTIKALIRHFADPEIGCVSGAKVIAGKTAATASGEGIYWKLESFLKKTETLTGSCSGADGAVYAVRKFLYSYPRDTTVIMDDFAVSLGVIKQGYRCVYEPAARAFESSGMLLREEFRRKARILAGALTAFFDYFFALWLYDMEMTFKLVSHKVIRWMGFPLMMAALVLNYYLLGIRTEGGLPVYDVLFKCQLAVYGLVMIGWALEALRIRIKPLFLLFYFVMTNLAQVYGVWQYMNRPRTGAWEKLKR